MPYKNIFLVILLIPFSLLGNDTDAQIKELKEARFKKEIELSELGKTIAEKQAYIESMYQEGVNFVHAKANEKNLNEQEMKEFAQKTDEELNSFVGTFNGAKDVKGFLVKELFKKMESEQIKESFEAAKFYLLLINNEYRILKTLIQKYEILEQERREINQKLTDLEK